MDSDSDDDYQDKDTWRLMNYGNFHELDIWKSAGRHGREYIGFNIITGQPINYL